MLTELVLLVLLVLLNAFFAASEIALISLNDNKVKSMAETGQKKWVLLSNLLREPSQFLATIQIGITLAGFLASAFAAESFATPMAEALTSLGIPLSVNVLENVSVIVITLLLSYFTLVFGELVPKRIAMQKYEALAMMAVQPLNMLRKVTSPFVKLLTASTNFILRLFGIDPHENTEKVTEEEILMMVDAGNESGAIQESERILINNIFEFDDKTVSDIMTHRSNVVGIPHDMDLQAIAKLAGTENYTRYPVYNGNMDNIIGILNVKDLIPYIEKGTDKPFDLQSLIRPPYYVPTSKRIDLLFQELQQNKIQMAIAIDEYGGTAGIVTLEDLLEEIVGNIFDEHDHEEKQIVKLDDSTYLIDAMINLRELDDSLELGLPVNDHDTLNGLLISILGRIPSKGEKPVIEYGNVVYHVLEVDSKRINKVKANILPKDFKTNFPLNTGAANQSATG